MGFGLYNACLIKGSNACVMKHECQINKMKKAEDIADVDSEQS